MNKKLITIILIGNLLWTGVNIYLYKTPRIEEDIKQKAIILALHKTKEKLRVADMRANYLEQLLNSKERNRK